MQLLELALRSKIPIIGIKTDDLVHVIPILQSIAGKKTQTLSTAQGAAISTDTILWVSEDSKAVSVATYKKLADAGASMVVINLPANSLVFDAGTLVTPNSFLVDYLSAFVAPSEMTPILQVLNGLSLKSVQEVVQLTSARVCNVLPKEIRRTRMMLQEQTPGLVSLDTEHEFYQMPKSIKEWLDLNKPYFLNSDTPAKLMPRGLMLVGQPGVGKTMSAKAIARIFDIPCFRLDIGTSLNRYLGESESRVARNLDWLEHNSPCVALLDEAEKLFGTSGNEGTELRILSQLLWWLGEHRSKVLMIMTSNDLTKLPKELYRPGRVDRVIEIPKLTLSESKVFATGVYESVIGKSLPIKRQKLIRDLLDEQNKGSLSHAEVSEFVYDLIKKNNWVKPE